LSEQTSTTTVPELSEPELGGPEPAKMTMASSPTTEPAVENNDS